MASYNCSKCPGYCCSYPLIELKKRDVERLAKHFGLSFKEAKKKFTAKRYGVEFSMRRKKDEYFGKICQFFDTDKRHCTVYKARPGICRDYPTGKCGYYEFLKIERDTQDDPDFIALTDNSK